MRLIGRDKLKSLRGQSEDTDKWLTGWMSEVAFANWKEASDVTNQFPHARQSGENKFQFRVLPGENLIEVMVAFAQGLVLITASTKSYDDTDGH